MLKVLFVCMGNICRSPTAEAVFRKLLTEQGLMQAFWLDSAGTDAYHVGEPPDMRTQKAAQKQGILMDDLRARLVKPQDFIEFDYILAMDKHNYHYLKLQCPQQYQHKLHLFLSFTPTLNVDEVPDPYMGKSHDFDGVFQLIEAGAQGLLKALTKE